MDNCTENTELLDSLDESTSGLTREEELIYFPAARNGDKEAYEYIISKNVNLVKFVALRYKFYDYCGYDDIFQEGMIGLCRAITDFDETKGFRFSSYAVNWIKQKITRYISAKRYLIRVPFNVLEKYRTLIAEFIEIEKEQGSVTFEDMLRYAKTKGIDEKELSKFLVLTNPASFSDIVFVGEKYGDDIERSENLQSDTDIEGDFCYKELKQLINKAMDKVLKQNERDVLNRRFGLNGHKAESLSDIAADYNVTREAIRQIQMRSAEKLKRTGILKDYKYFER